jgi:hypothetical protein
MAKTKLELQREYLKRTNYASNNRYNAANTTVYAFRVVRNTEQDIIEKLENVENKSGYLKRLIREDIMRETKAAGVNAESTESE